MTRGAPRRPRAAIVATLAAVAALAVFSARAATQRALDGLARTVADGLSAVGEELARAEVDEGEAGPSVEEIVSLARASPIEIPRGAVERVPMSHELGSRELGSRGRAIAPTHRAAEPPPMGILVRAAVVRAAISRGGRPSGTPIGASGARPAGLVMSGVSVYGSALRDGDVLTRVGGTPATSASRVIGAVSGAVRSGARAIDGEVWRGEKRIQVVVELPRLAKPRRKKG